MILDVTDETFEAEVIQRSASMPVVVDLWAPWCGPCRTLGPIIEAAVAQANEGHAEPQVTLVKINVDENPQASAAFRVQSIPAVYALKDSQVVDHFLGAQPEAAVRQFISGLLPSPTESAISELLEKGDEASLLAVLDIDPGHPGAVKALAQIKIDAGQHQAALDLLARIPETDDARVLAALARTGLTAADSQNADIETRLERLLDQVKGDDDARQEFLDLLAVLGADHPNTAEWRKRLSNRLF